MDRSTKSLIVFFLIAFGIPWIGWTLVQTLGESLSPTQRMLLFYTGDFCSVAGFVAVYVESGRAGVRALWQRCIQVRVPIFWWAFVFVVPFGITLGSIHAWGLSGHHVGPADSAALLTLFTPALMRNLTTGPLGEEAGWRGYLLPKLLQKHSALTASLMIGVIWGIWHLPLYIDGEFSTISGAAFFTLNTVFFSVIMTAIFNHTRKSVFVAVIFHWFINMMPLAVLNMYEGITLEDILSFMSIGYAFVTLVLILLMGKDLKWRPKTEAI